VLHRATRKAWVSMVQLLLVYGADVKAKDDMGQTVLHTTLSGIKYPGWKGRDWEEGMIELLLNMGADANVRDCFGKTALDLAESRGHESAAALLNARMTESEKPRKRLRR
jgi:ankyrin repeat protein